MKSVFVLLVACNVATVLSTSILGGPKAIQPGDADATEAAQFAVGKLSNASNSEYALVMTSLVKGTKQVCNMLLKQALHPKRQ